MAVVNSLIAIYNAIESFIEYLRQMLEIVSRVLDGILDIARGAIDGAAAYLESALGSAMPVAIGLSQQIQVSVSIGGAFAPQWVRSTPSLWLERADQQLYLAKAQGRNLVRMEPTPVSVVSVEEKRLLFETSQFQDHE